MIELTPNAKIVLERRYLKNNETAEEMFHRVAEAVASAENNEGDKKKYRELFYYLISSLDFLPNTPCLMNAGKELGMCFACYVLPVGDSMEEIFDAIKNTALVQKAGGGTGFSFSNLRPANDVVKSTKGISSGSVSFMKVFNAATEAIKQGSTRRGANIAVLHCTHPDIEEFIQCKTDGKELNNFNISVVVTDGFMEAVKNNKSYNLINPRNKEIVRKAKARGIFDLICREAWKTGDPGLVFIDEINRKQPIEGDIIEGVNPCGEMPLCSYESCCLGSINLGHMLDVNSNKINYKRLGLATRLAVRFLDNIIDINKYPLEQIKIESKRRRKIGLGVMGWADLLIKLGIDYDIPEAFALAEKVMEFINKVAIEESMELGKEKGNFELVNSLKDKQKRRNATVTTIAPTGSISIIADCSSGIEPLFSLDYTRNILDGEQLKEKHNVVAKTSHEIHYSDHIRMQAAFQRHVQNATSKTINMSNNATVEDISNAYLLAYDMKLKGITVFRDGCRDKQVLVKTKDKKVIDINGIHPRERTGATIGKTYKVRTGCGNLYVTVNNDSLGLCEVFCQMGKGGGCTASQSEAMSRLISLCLRSGISHKEIIHQLERIRCSSPAWYNSKQILSCADAVAQILREHEKGNGIDIISKNTEKAGICPDCGEVLYFVEGCTKCNYCGYSKC